MTQPRTDSLTLYQSPDWTEDFWKNVLLLLPGDTEAEKITEKISVLTLKTEEEESLAA